MNTEVGSYEAKTKLPELLRGVQNGHRYTITLRGEAIAELIPAASAKKSNTQAAVARMQAFMKQRLIDQPVDIQSLIEEGRD